MHRHDDWGAIYFFVFLFKVLKAVVKFLASIFDKFKADPVNFFMELGLFFTGLFFGFTLLILLSFTGFNIAAIGPFFFTAFIFLYIYFHKKIMKNPLFRPKNDYMRLCRTKRDDESIMLCVAVQIEGRLEKLYGAEGRGLNEKLDFLIDKGLDVPSDLIKKIRKVATIRNKLAHNLSGANMPDRKIVFDLGNEIVTGVYKLDNKSAVIDDEDLKYKSKLKFLFAAIGLFGVLGSVFLIFR